MDIVISSITQGAIWAVMAIGVYMTFRLINIADLSAEGVFPLGAAVAAISIRHNVPPIIATLLAFGAGALAGGIAGIIHTKLNIPSLLTGILMLTGLYTININVMGGKANISLLGKDTIFSQVQKILNVSKYSAIFIVTTVILCILIIILLFFLNTQIGLAFRATGDNVQMSQMNGIHTNRMTILGYMIGNGLIALCGAMITQKDGFSDVGMGIGTIAIGLAAIIIVEVLMPDKPLKIRIPSIIIGSIIYRFIIDTILNQSIITIQSTDLRLYSAVLLGLILYLPTYQQKKRNNIDKKGNK